MAFIDYFIGSEQSKYASIAMFAAIIAICLAILFTNTDVSIGNRIGIVFFVLLISILPVAMSLFELTCIVTGSKNKKYNLCNIFAWIVCVMIIIYSTILILSIIYSIFTYKKALQKIEVEEKARVVSNEDADIIAQNMINTNDTSQIEKYQDIKELMPLNTQNPQKIEQAGPIEPIETVGTFGQFAKIEQVEQVKPVLNVPKTQEIGKGDSSIQGFDKYEQSQYSELEQPTIEKFSNPDHLNNQKKKKAIVEQFQSTKKNSDQVEGFDTMFDRCNYSTV